MTLEFKIQIKNITKPPVWRRLRVPAQFTFDDFHRVIQIAFGWEGYHLYNFSPTGWASHPYIAIPHEDDFEKPDYDSTKVKLSNIFKTQGQKFVYIYDFGDDWQHKITLENILPEKTKIPVCIGGKGAAVPEDCGGVWGYERLKEILQDPQDEEYEDMLEWLGLDSGDEWDANELDIPMINQDLMEAFQ